MPGIKLAIIGGGSPYMTSMLGTVARYAQEGGLAGTEVVLMDINEENVKQVYDWAVAGIENDKLPLKISWTTNLDEALPGSDFVLSSFRVGGLDGRYLDETIPVKYHELGSETVGIGGVFYCLRTVPAIMRLSEAMQKHCPNAWLVHYSNPTYMVCDATMRAGHSKTIGLCDGIFGVRWLACKLLGISPSRAHEIDAYVSGVNHFTWCMKLFHGERDLYAEMDELVAKADLTPGAGYEVIDENRALNQIEVDCCRLYKIFGILPGSAYYARYYYTLRDYLDHLCDPAHEHRSQWLKGIREEKFAKIRAELANGTARIAPLDHEDSAHGDQAIGAIHAIANDTREIDAVNVRNNGVVPNLPVDRIVEVSCTLGHAGALPIAPGPLPKGVETMIRAASDFGSLAVDAALSGDKRDVMQAVMAHPAHRDLDIAEKMVNELFEAHEQWLPQFK